MSLEVTPSTLQSLWPQSQMLLNATLVAKGVEHQGSDARLACVRGMLARKERMSMSAVGGSITAGSSYAAGSGSAATFLYHRKVAMALDMRFPVASGHGHLNGGVPGTGPTYMEHCVHDHLPADVNLVLLEYAVNTDRRPAAFERLLRKLILHPRSPAIIVVNAHRWRAIRPHDGRTDKCWHRNWPVDMVHNRTQWLAQSLGRREDTRDVLAADEDEIAKLCAHYDVPLVSMRSALVGAVRTGEIALPSFMSDCKHPTGAGHSFLAQLVLHRLLHAPPLVSSDASSPPPSSSSSSSSSVAADDAAVATGRCAPDARALPAPFYGGAGQEMASSVCARGGQLGRYAEMDRSSGFNLTDEGRGKGKIGLLANGVGRSISFCLPWPDPTHAGQRPPQVLWLGFLRSYEHMGRARVSCSGGCACAPDVIDAHDIKDGVSVTDVRRIGLRPNRRRAAAAAPAATGADSAAADDVGCCHVRLEITDGTSSGEHKFKVMSLLLGGADAHSLQVFSLRVAASASETDVGGDAQPRQPRKGKGRGGGRGRARRAAQRNGWAAS
jgi:hypothetical protein